MYGIGVDLVTVSRIKKSCESERFRNFVYSEKELCEYYSCPKPKFNSLRGNYAAKEAFGKRLGSGISGFSLNEVEILRNEEGMPYFNFYGKALHIVRKNNIVATCSISHEKDLAVAFVCLESKKQLIPL